MKIRKLTDAYCYLELKGQNRFEEFALKMLWLADKQHLLKYCRSISGCELPITKLPELPIEKCKTCGITRRIESKPCSYGPFGELSRSDMKMLDEVFIAFEEMTQEQIDAFEIHEYKSLEELFEGKENAADMIELIREDQAIEQSLFDAGFTNE